MKLNLRLYISLTFYFLALYGLQAQTGTGSKNGSRLLMGKQNATASKPSRILVNQSGLDRTINYKPSQAFNSFYRSTVFSASNNVATKETNGRKASSGEISQNSSEIKSGSEILKTEDKFFSSEKITVNNIYPNPANEAAEIEYSIVGNVSEAKIVLYNALAMATDEYVLDRNSRSIRISTSQIPTGIYYYQLLLDGKKVATKKLLVRH